MFVDATVVKDGATPFAGEATLRKTADAQRSKDATPRQVMETFVLALENGDQATWNSLFATWRADKWKDHGDIAWYPYYPTNLGLLRAASSSNASTTLVSST